MAYTKIALILYAIALLTFILLGVVGGFFKSSPAPYEGLKEGLILLVVEPILLISAIAFSVLACTKEKGMLSKLPLTIPIVIITIVLSLIFLKYVFNTFHKKEVLTGSSLSEISQKINEGLPKMIDENVRLDMTMSYEMKIDYTFTVLDTTLVEENCLSVIAKRESDVYQKLFSENNVKVWYVIRDSEGNHFAAFEYVYGK